MTDMSETLDKYLKYEQTVCEIFDRTNTIITEATDEETGRIFMIFIITRDINQSITDDEKKIINEYLLWKYLETPVKYITNPNY